MHAQPSACTSLEEGTAERGEAAGDAQACGEVVRGAGLAGLGMRELGHDPEAQVFRVEDLARALGVHELGHDPEGQVVRVEDRAIVPVREHDHHGQYGA